jgi:hypothetical protein
MRVICGDSFPGNRTLRDVFWPDLNDTTDPRVQERLVEAALADLQALAAAAEARARHRLSMPTITGDRTYGEWARIDLELAQAETTALARVKGEQA